MKNIIKTIFCVVLVCAMFGKVYNIFTWKETNGITHFYQLEENSADVIFYGSSHCYCTINNALLWDKYGIASYNMGESGQNLGSTYAYMVESLKTQAPKVMCVELCYASWYEEGFNNGNLYRNTIGLKWSENYLSNLDFAIGRSVQSDNTELKREIFLKWPIIHSRYSEITAKDFWDNSFEHGRYEGSWTCESYEFPREAYNCKEIGSLREDDLLYLEKMVDLAKDKGIQLVFFIAPFVLHEENQKAFNAAAEFARNNGVPFLNFNTDQFLFLDFDYTTDMREEGHSGSHLNNFGAEKITIYIGQFLKENFDLPDRVQENGYDYYNIITKYYQSSCNTNRLVQTEIFEDYLNELNRDDYTFFISISGNCGNNADINNLLMESYGIDAVVGKNWVIKKDKILFCDENQDVFTYHIDFKDAKLAVTTKSGREGMYSLLYNHNLENKVENGINVLVYNNIMESYVESVGFDSDKDFACVR